MKRRTFRDLWRPTSCVTCGQEFLRHVSLTVPHCLSCRNAAEFSARVAQMNAVHIEATREGA